jgi:LacI family transcriptional regulator
MRKAREQESGERRATRADVAKLAGVSSTTVSFVLNENSGQTISPETRHRVLDAVAQLDYRPNRAAQGLRTGRTATVGFVTYDADFGAFAARTIEGAQEAAIRHGSMLLIMNAARDPALVRASINEMLDRQVDALIFAVAGTRRVTLPDNVKAVPTVLVNCYTPGGVLPSVLPDETRGGRESTQLLIDRGHRDIAYLTGLAGSWATRARLRGYREALRAAGIDARRQPILPGNFRVDSGYALAQQVLTRQRRPTAMLCGNDRMALGAYLALLEAGLRVPENVSIMGYDDQECLAGEIHPPLSTVRLPYYEMGRWAAEQVFAGTLDRLPPRTYVPCPIVVRDSVAYTSNQLRSA